NLEPCKGLCLISFNQTRNIVEHVFHSYVDVLCFPPSLHARHLPSPLVPKNLSAECMEPVFMLRPLQNPDPSYLFVLPHEQRTAHFGVEGPSTLLSTDDGALRLLTAVLPQ
ncbi:hypothetical protein Vafri_18846, partial [Volvox africanus]